MQTKKIINPELLNAILQYKRDIELSRKNPMDKILKIQVAYSKYIIKSLILKEYINGN